MPEIAESGSKNCVNHGLSIMRAALGYDKLPESKTGSKRPSDILAQVGAWFPKHEVKVACSKESRDNAGELPENVSYIGTLIPWPFDFDKHIVGFAYYTVDDNEGHFVIGQPVLYKHMHTSIVVLVDRG